MSWLKTNCGDYIDCLLPFSTGGWVSIPVSGSSVGSFTSGMTSPATSEVTCVEMGATWLTTESAMPGTESSFPSSIAVTITVSPRSSRCHVSYQCCPQSFGFFGEFSSFYPQQSHKHCSAVWRSPLGTSKVILEYIEDGPLPKLPCLLMPLKLCYQLAAKLEPFQDIESVYDIDLLFLTATDKQFN